MMENDLKEASAINKVISGGYCIGCGGCAVQDNNIHIEDDSLRMPQARLDQESIHSNVCPFASTTSEDEIARQLYENDSFYDERVGFYLENYVGHVAALQYRSNASSGGMVTWILAELFQRGEIDGVVHVGEGKVNLFEYQVSETLDEIIKKSKSRYYPVHYDKALKGILGNGKKYAFVGIPCFVKSIRLLARSNNQVADSISYCISIFCGHSKTKAFSEMLAMQQGVAANEIASVDFRVKNSKQPANRYSVQVFCKDKDGVINAKSPISTRELYGLDWGLGYFKPKACDWCDDIVGETADISCGDAWLPETVGDSLGNNIIVVRNKLINEIIGKGLKRNDLVLYPVSVEKVYQSQAGNYRHRREGLAVRIEDAVSRGDWTPPKRIAIEDYKVSPTRKRIYRLREKISERSHVAFEEAKNKKKFSLFIFMMLPLEVRYYFLNKNLARGLAKVAYQFGNYLLRRIY